VRYLRLLLFLFLDFLLLSLVLLLFSYYGVGHLFLVLLGLLVLGLGYYDIATGRISELMVLIFGFSLSSGEGFRWANYLPFLGAVALIFYSILSFWEYGIVNTAQQKGLQQVDPALLFVTVVLLSLIITLLALAVYLQESRKK